MGLTIWDDTHADVRVVGGSANFGCTITSPGEIRSEKGISDTPAQCADWLEQWKVAVAAASPDVAFVQFGPWEVYELRPAGIADFYVVGHPELDARIARNLGAGLEVLLGEQQGGGDRDQPVHRARPAKRPPASACLPRVGAVAHGPPQPDHP